MKIKIPEIFEKKLIGDYRIYIDGLVTNYSSIIQDNKLEFFSEFTDHGIEHVEDVLITASNLIDKNTLELLNVKDITVLIASVILHDIGMHISSEGLKTILQSDFDKFRISYFNDKTWSQEWQEFLYEAKRFNDEQLENIFGDSKVEIEDPKLDEQDDKSRKLCGEFIRRHHARLAHEIVFSGFPTIKGQPNVKQASNLNEDIIDICGLVARSHGINLRDSFDYLRSKHIDAWKTPYDIKIIFIMVVLRISDYIQIHSQRANSILLKTKKFSSPISIMEWQKHDAIKHINIKTDDPERIFVVAKPVNSLIFLELKKLFTDIQYEFDLSWAILGEVYGRDTDLNSLKIKYRRLTSNIDNIESFEKTVEFIPKKIHFNADPELLKLLIGPLYGEDPKYGIRELLQNSVDAVKERSYAESFQDGKILIELKKVTPEDNEYSLMIKDNGVGMTKDTIIDFFFKAGASFRNSMIWKKSYIEDSEVKVEKTGRFGVGVLAVFLLGEEFELFTKNYKDTMGYYCKASLNTKQVELLKKDCDVGTKIIIKLSDKNLDLFKKTLKALDKYQKHSYYYDDDRPYLNWFNWYVMDFPKIEYNIDPEVEPIFDFKKINVSSEHDKPLKGWYSFKTDNFKAVHWSIYAENSQYRRKNLPHLFCNGFNIIRGYKIPNFPWKEPVLSVFDGNAKMPLSLSRDYLLNDRLPFEKELGNNICLFIIKKLNSIEFDKIGGHWVPRASIINFHGFELDMANFIVVKGDQFTLLTPFIFKELKIKKFYQIWLKHDPQKNYLFSDKKTFYQTKRLKNDPNYFYKEVLDFRNYGSNIFSQWFNLGQGIDRNDLFSNDYVLNDKLVYMMDGNRLSKSFRNKYSRSRVFNARWGFIKKLKTFESYQFKEKKEHEAQIKRVEEETKIVSTKLSHETFYFVKENYLSEFQSPEFSQFKETWEKTFGGNKLMIPINKEFRKNIP